MEIGSKLWRMLNPEAGECKESWADSILRAEEAFLQEKRSREKAPAGDPVVGIALSGGGIRSATFNLGILTVLEKLGLLKLADYLSTVSGGGYVGSYVIANRMRGNGLKDEDGAGNKPLAHLRKYGNYLSPSLGAMSTDTWAMAMVWFRNTSMLQLFLCTVFALVLLMPRLWAMGLTALVQWPHVTELTIPLSILAFHVLTAMLCVALASSFAPPQAAATATGKTSRSGVRRIVAVASFFALADCVLFTIGAFRPFANGGVELSLLAEEFALTLGSCGFYLALFSLGFAHGFRPDGNRWMRIVYGVLFVGVSTAVCMSPSLIPSWRVVVAPLLAVAVAGIFLWFGKGIFQYEDHEIPQDLGRSLLAAMACGGVSLGGILLANSLFGDAAHRALQVLEMSAKNCSGAATAGLSCITLASEDIWRYAIFASPGLLATIGCCIVFLIGITGRAMPDLVREGWSRLGALVYMNSMFFLIVGLIGVYGPLGILALWDAWNGYVLASGGVVTALVGLASLLAAQSGGTSGKSAAGKGRMELVAEFGPWLFIVLLLCTVSLAVHMGLAYAALSDRHAACAVPSKAEFVHRSACVAAGDRTDSVQQGRPLFDCPDCESKPEWQGKWKGPGLPGAKLWIEFHWQLLGSSTGGNQRGLLLLSCGGLLALAMLLLWRLDINEFSINRFYRNRIVRCFMGAARADIRRPDPITDFDLDDDIRMDAIWKGMTGGTNSMMGRETPIPVVNTALNAVGGEDAAMAERRAESFFFSPFGAGSFSTGAVDLEQASTGRKPGDVTLGSLVATSGAAANPNMGFHTSPAVAFLLTFFNVRLGWWLGIPDRLTGIKRYFNLPYVFFELFGTADPNDAYVNLSDGGHFENLGLYELVRRQCDLIVVGDGEQDDKYVFESLGMAVRKCRIDFEAEITIDPQPVRPVNEGGLNGRHWLVGKIVYKGGKVGYLLYLKSSFTGREPYDVQQYRLANPEFPQQSTADQFFDESQLESYRQLGKHAAEELEKALGARDSWSTRAQWLRAAEALYAKG